MNERPLYAPGCFGSSNYADDDCCRSCPFKTQCAPLHERRMEQLRDFLGIKVKKPTRQAGSLPAKVQKIFEELGKTEEEVRRAMLSGINPYSVREGFVGIVAHLVLHLGQTTRQRAKEVLMARRGYNEATADVYARHSIQILAHCKVLEVNGDEIRLSKVSTETNE